MPVITKESKKSSASSSSSSSSSNSSSSSSSSSDDSDDSSSSSQHSATAAEAQPKKSPVTPSPSKKRAPPKKAPVQVPTSSSSSNPKSKLVKSGSVTNTKTIKAKPKPKKKLPPPPPQANSASSSESADECKRPVTRRLQNKQNKTIPTTTLFNHLIASPNKSPQVSSPPGSPPQKNKYLSTWDSDFSDDNNLIYTSNNLRVPAKTSLKPDLTCYSPPTCPFPSCDSQGHLSGRHVTHNFLSCCPKYHGFDPIECENEERLRSSRESERSRYRNVLSTPGKKPPKPTPETKSWLAEMKELKSLQMGIVSNYDDLLWKDALALAADKIEKEQNEGNNGVFLMRIAMAVAMGSFEMKCWCPSPYPEPLSHNRRLFVCEFCLKPLASSTILRRHCAKCVWRHPPGDEIYRKDRLSVWEVDGKKQKTYCQNLCLLAKCFLDHKTLYLDVDPFLFYVMTLADSQGCHVVGYFSKEKNSFLNYNVSCILTLPPYQRQGFGRLLIDFSYLLTRVELKVGSPEKPLSDLGLISYRSYWKDAVLRRMCACASREVNIKDLSIELGVSTADLISTLQFLGMLKYWKGKHLVLKKQDVLEEYLERVRKRGNEQRQIDSSCLRWRPYQPDSDTVDTSEKN